LNQAAAKEIELHIKEVSAYAGGRRDGGWWKSPEYLPEDIDLEGLLKKAFEPKVGLVNGPGIKVSQAKEALSAAVELPNGGVSFARVLRLQSLRRSCGVAWPILAKRHD
jgi:hypothetical protein